MPAFLMRRKKQGIKIYQAKRRRGRMFTKRRRSPVLSVLLMLVLSCGAGMLGYHIAGPLLRYIHSEQPIEDDTEPTLQAEAVTEASEQATHEPQMTDPPATTASEEVETTAPLETNLIAPVGESFAAYRIEEDALESLPKLRAALLSMPEGCSTAVVPLKCSGGAVQYVSEVEGVVSGALTLSEIGACAAEAGVTLSAELSLLHDNVYPDYDWSAGYCIEEDGTRWLDDKPSEGGKPWLSPFSESARQYLSDLVQELSESGFRYLYCTDVVFPDFYQTDLEYIGEMVQSSEQRADAAADLLSQLDRTAQSAGAEVVYTFSLYDALNQTEEALNSEHSTASLMAAVIDDSYFQTPFWYDNVRYDLSQCTVAERVQKLMGIAEHLAEPAELIPCLDRSSFGDRLPEAIEAIQLMGYTRYLLLP